MFGLSVALICCALAYVSWRYYDKYTCSREIDQTNQIMIELKLLQTINTLELIQIELLNAIVKSGYPSLSEEGMRDIVSNIREVTEKFHKESGEALRLIGEAHSKLSPDKQEMFDKIKDFFNPEKDEICPNKIVEKRDVEFDELAPKKEAVQETSEPYEIFCELKMPKLEDYSWVIQKTQSDKEGGRLKRSAFFNYCYEIIVANEGKAVTAEVIVSYLLLKAYKVRVVTELSEAKQLDMKTHYDTLLALYVRRPVAKNIGNLPTLLHSSEIAEIYVSDTRKASFNIIKSTGKINILTAVKK